ncbi:hypothetical protein GOB93_14095 [Acetobacter musti]|uniref:Uncharacterized protein n=1 Tax=Acetobacter musti TaxID=864732 RepID=A0ABX0JW93_9PROT|nr:hypothetical protein [Acetobacter musti]NHN85764.1 hypothetical protein [Acetobacter musti]
MSDDAEEMPNNVVSIGEYLFEKRNTSYGRIAGIGGEENCTHPALLLDSNGDVVTCKDCGKQVSAFWALHRCLDEYRKRWNDVVHAKRQQREREIKTLRLKSAQTIEKAWRRRGTVPTCPHCDRGIFPTDRFGAVGKALEIEAREKDPQDKWSQVASCEVVRAFEKAAADE